LDHALLDERGFVLDFLNYHLFVASLTLLVGELRDNGVIIFHLGDSDFKFEILLVLAVCAFFGLDLVDLFKLDVNSQELF